MILRLWALLFLFAVTQANRALACPVCFSAKNEENQIAYIVTTGFLTFLPLLFAGGLMLWIRRRAQQAEQDSGSHSAQVLLLDPDRAPDA